MEKEIGIDMFGETSGFESVSKTVEIVERGELNDLLRKMETALAQAEVWVELENPDEEIPVGTRWNFDSTYIEGPSSMAMKIYAKHMGRTGISELWDDMKSVMALLKNPRTTYRQLHDSIRTFVSNAKSRRYGVEIMEGKTTSEEKSFLYKSSDVVGWATPDGDVVCPSCARGENTSSWSPIFAGSEWDYKPACSWCGERIEAISVIRYEDNKEPGKEKDNMDEDEKKKKKEEKKPAVAEDEDSYDDWDEEDEDISHETATGLDFGFDNDKEPEEEEMELVSASANPSLQPKVTLPEMFKRENVSNELDLNRFGNVTVSRTADGTRYLIRYSDPYTPLIGETRAYAESQGLVRGKDYTFTELARGVWSLVVYNGGSVQMERAVFNSELLMDFMDYENGKQE